MPRAEKVRLFNRAIRKLLSYSNVGMAGESVSEVQLGTRSSGRAIRIRTHTGAFVGRGKGTALKNLAEELYPDVIGCTL
jgi:hypothetical protein